MTRSTEDIIAQLSAQAKPVRRLAPPAQRAAVWLILLAAIGATWVVLRADVSEFLLRTGTVRAAWAWAASLATGVTAVLAAAYLSLPDRSRFWAFAPVPFMVVWLGLSSLGCIGLDPHPDEDSTACFRFILITGLPMAAFLLWRLRRAHPMDSILVTAVGGLGAAGLSAALLQFFHPFAITWLDLAVHLAGVTVVVAAGGLAGAVASTDPH